MTTLFTRQARDLSAEERAAVEKLLGRPLADDEAFDIHTYRPHEAPKGEARKKAAAELAGAMEEISAGFRDAPSQELEEEIDRACEEVRRSGG